MLQVNYDGGPYELGLITFKPGETKTFDIRKLRDDQTPDRNGHPFPRDLTTGQIRWSMRGNGSLPLFGRAEVVSHHDSVSSSYSCVTCCPNSFYDGWLDPGYSSIFAGDSQQLLGKERQRDCSGNMYGPYDTSWGSWYAANPDIATVDSNGLANGIDAGTASFSFTWTTYYWMIDYDQTCTYYESSNTGNSSMDVCSKPTGETTASGGWADADGYPTVHKWNQTLLPVGTNFSGRTVTERDPGGGGPDTCYFDGSIFLPLTSITGGTWSVGANNTWGPDWVGWIPRAVTYYRDQGRVPCSTFVTQRMVIDCASAEMTYSVTFPSLEFDIQPVLVTSRRAEGQASRSWP